MSLTIRDLKEIIEDMPDDVEVRLITQPSWPFEYSVNRAITAEDLLRLQYEDDLYNDPDVPEGLTFEEWKEENVEDFDAENDNHLYLGEESQLGYASGWQRKIWEG